MSIWSRIERRFDEIAGEFISEEFREQLAQARQNFHNEQFYQAETIALKLLASRPEHTSTRILLGLTQIQQAKYKQATETFDAALARDKRSPQALIGRGNATYALGAEEQAIPYFRAAVESAGGDRAILGKAYHGLGLAYHSSGDIAKSIRELRKAVAESSGDARVIADFGDVLSQTHNGSNSEARRYLERIAAKKGCPPIAWIALGRISLHDNDGIAAIQHFYRVIHSADFPNEQEYKQQAWLGIADANLLIGHGREAETALKCAQDHGDESSTTLAKLAESKLLQQDNEAAMQYFKNSLQPSNPEEENIQIARQALALALRTGDITTGVHMANRVLTSSPADSNALTARGLYQLSCGDTTEARDTYKKALKYGNNFETLLALAALELHEGEPEIAETYAKQALLLDPGSSRGQKLLSQCSAENLGFLLKEDIGWYDLATAMSNLCTKQSTLIPLASRASNALSEYDQPLLVAVMGEFSSGKSSFVNAFLDAEVAPTGVIPTTATINIVKYGREKGARVVYKDGTSREIKSANLSAHLNQIDETQALRIRHVEILMPIDILERVHIVDTPGFNSIVKEHEAVARSFLQRADAVIWIFTANQAGKSSERKALDNIRKTDVRVLGVLNKIDQLDSGQIREILSYIKGEVGDRMEACIPLSTKRAIQHKEQSGWSDIRRELESRFFCRARDLKRNALNRRLGELLQEALTIATTTLEKRCGHNPVLRDSANAARTCQTEFVTTIIAQERKQITQDVAALYRSAAKETLELVRPRQLPFGAHKASQADRDYLLGLLDSGFEHLLDASKVRCNRHIRGTAEKIFPPQYSPLESIQREMVSIVDESLRFIESEVWNRCFAFVRGFHRGGFVDQFFHTDLPKIDLSEDSVYMALFRNAPDVDVEIASALSKAGEHLLGTLATRLEELSATAELEAFEIRSGLIRAIETLSDHRERLAAML